MLITSTAITLSLAMSLGWVPMGSRWETLPVSYCITPNATKTALTPQQQTAAIEQAINYWRDAASGGGTSCTTFNAIRANYSCTPGHSGGDLHNNISFVTDWSHGKQALGVTQTSFYDQKSCGKVTDDTGKTTQLFCNADSDIVINDRDYTWRADGADTDLVSVVAHEFGHFLGLGHCDDNNTCAKGNAVMAAFYSGSQLRAPRADDREGICALYPKSVTDLPGAGEPCPGNSCAEGLDCLTSKNNTTLCAAPCDANSRCADNFACAQTGAGDYCLPAVQEGQSCGDGTACAGGYCLIRPNNPQQALCYRSCADTTACGATQTCTELLVEDQTLQVCVPKQTDPGQTCGCNTTNACDANCGCDPQCVQSDNSIGSSGCSHRGSQAETPLGAALAALAGLGLLLWRRRRS